MMKKGRSKGTKKAFVAYFCHFGPLCRALFRHLTELGSFHRPETCLYKILSSRLITPTLYENWQTPPLRIELNGHTHTGELEWHSLLEEKKYLHPLTGPWSIKFLV